MCPNVTEILVIFMMNFDGQQISHFEDECLWDSLWGERRKDGRHRVCVYIFKFSKFCLEAHR